MGSAHADALHLGSSWILYGNVFFLATINGQNGTILLDMVDHNVAHEM